MRHYAEFLRGRTGPLAGGALALSLMACSESPADAQHDPFANDPACTIPTELTSETVIQDVSVVDAAHGTVAAGRTVLIRDGRIAAVGAPADVPVPAQAVLLPGCGRFLTPGLSDMHVHLSRADLQSYLDAGVTTVRNLWGFTDLLAMQAEVAAGSLQGPTIYVVSSGIDGLPVKWPFTQLALSPDDAETVVSEQAALGYRTLKLYQDLDRPTFDALVSSAKKRSLDYGGHVPHRVGLNHALASGFRFVEHLSGYELALNGGTQRGAFGWRTIDESRIPALVQQTIAAGTWNCPTLQIFDQLAGGDQGVVRNRQRMVKALFDAGAPLLAGTDSGIDVARPGVSLHQELEHFRSAGLSPAAALKIATVEAARFLNAEADFGRIEPGLRADLLLVGGNPLSDLSVLADPIAVIARGVRVR